MLVNKIEKEKKDWSPPKLKNLSIRKTLGGETFAEGEDDYADPDPTNSI